MQQTATVQPTGWHIAKWGFWGWLETAVKGIGIVTGWVALLTALPIGALTIGGNPRLAAIALLALLTFAAVGVNFVRLRQREVVSQIYALANASGHLAMLVTLLGRPDLRAFGVVFGIAYVAGELVKQRFLTVSGYTEGGAKPAQMVMVSRVLMVFYIVFTVLLLV